MDSANKIPLPSFFILFYSVLLFIFSILTSIANIVLIIYCSLLASLAILLIKYRYRHVSQLFPIALIGVGFTVGLVYSVSRFFRLSSYSAAFGLTELAASLYIGAAGIFVYCAAHILFALQAAVFLIPVSSPRLLNAAKKLRFLPSILMAVPEIMLVGLIIIIYGFSKTDNAALYVFICYSAVTLAAIKLIFTTMLASFFSRTSE